MPPDITYHYPAELLALLIDTIPLLNRSKRDVVTFFRGAGVPRDITDTLTQRLREAPNETNKYEMVRVVLDRLNSRGEGMLGVRRELLRRVVEFSNFDSCWPADQLPAKGFVASIREVVNQKDAFTRMAQERDQEHKARVAQANALAKERQQKVEKIEAAKKEFYGLFGSDTNPQSRGKKLETALNNTFAAHGILLRQAFHLIGPGGEGIVEQIDGVIEIGGSVYLVEMKWYKEPVGFAEISQHLVRLMNRAEARGIFISASSFTQPAIQATREFLQHKVMALATLQEFVQVFEHKADLADHLQKKVQAAIIHKNPFYNPYNP